MSELNKTRKILLAPIELTEDGKLKVTVPTEIQASLKDLADKVVLRRVLPDYVVKECPIATEASSIEEKLQSLMCQYLTQLRALKEKK